MIQAYTPQYAEDLEAHYDSEGKPDPIATVEAELQAIMLPLVRFIAEKHVGYGESFDRIYRTYGIFSLGPRLADKYNRIEHCLLNPNEPGSGDKMLDAIRDMVGYCLLTLRLLDKEKGPGD